MWGRAREIALRALKLVQHQEHEMPLEQCMKRSLQGDTPIKRLMPAGLIQFLQNNRNMEKADLFVIELPNGEILNATSGQWDVSVPFDVVTGPDASGTSNGDSGSTITSETISPGSGTDFAVFVASNNESNTPSGWTGVAGCFNTLQLDSVAPLSATTNNPGSYPWASVIATFQTSGPVTKEQSIDFGSGSFSGTITETFSADINAGDTIFVYISGLGPYPYSGSVSVSDNNGNEYHAIAAFNTTGEETGQAWLFYALNCNAGSTSVTLVLPETIGDGNAAGYSYSGIFGGAPPTTFFATKYGRWSRGTITSEASFAMTANTMALTCAPQPATAFPGNPVGVLNAALNGLFDAAQVTVYTAYFPLGQYGFLAGGPGSVETKFKGTITRIVDINRVHVEFECGDPMYLLNMKVPRRLMQPNCPWSVTDENCTLNAGGVDINGFDMTQAFTLSSGTQYVLFPATPFVQPEGYFSQGVVTCTAGNNAGLSQTVKLHASGELQLLNPWLLPVSVGDTFSVLVGCDHTPTTCTVKFGNLINFGGTPFVPPSESAV
jgi:uncharacterized phage protein (TIGR02218 family)